MCSLDVETLISVLQNRQLQGFLKADLASGGDTGTINKGAVIIKFKEGTLLSIIIYDRNGRNSINGRQTI